MDDFLKQIFPIGKTRWIKLKYLDYDKFSQWLRLKNRSDHNPSEHLGIEIHSIGVIDDYTPQIQALVEMKVEFEQRYYMEGLGKDPLELFNNVVDNKIESLLNEIAVNRR